jgi:ubiquinone biosynthesis protein
MSGWVRLFFILRIAARYRLDTLLTTTGLPWAARVLVAPLHWLPQPKANRGVRLRRALEDLGPIFVKFGQLLSTRPDLIPADICAELDRLQDKVPPFPGEQFVAIVEHALGDKVENLFQSFERTPLASASVAQVHAAVLPDGRDVVVKAIRPGIDKIVEKDCALLLTLATLIERYSADGRRLRPVDVARDYRHTVLDELNLQSEGANASILRRNFARSPLLYVPEIHWPYSNERVLVMERIRAIPVTDIATLTAKGTDFQTLAERGVEIFFTQVFEHNFFHADMHPGNIFVDADNPRQPRYLAVDCAIIGTLSGADQYYLARNLLAIFRRDYRQVAELHVLCGWVPEKTPVNEFEAAIRTVCEPIFERPLKDISCGQMLVNLFRTARRFNAEIQPSLVLLQKTLINIEGLGRQLYPELDLWSTAHPYMERWLKRRFKPATILEQFKRHGPEWLEQLPQMPQLLFQATEQIKHLDRSLAQPPKPAQPPALRSLGAASLGVAIGLAVAHWDTALGQPPLAAIAFGVAGGLLLLLR